MEPSLQDRQDLQREFGQYLKSQRERRRISLDEASKTLRISEDNLRALEKGSFSKLPRMPFVLGLVNSYGRYIGCDSTQLQQRVAGLRPLLPPHAALDTVGKPNDPQLVDVHKPSFYVTQKLLFMVAGVGVLAVAVWIVLGVFSPQITQFMKTQTTPVTIQGDEEGVTERVNSTVPPSGAALSTGVQKWENPGPASVPESRD